MTRDHGLCMSDGVTLDISDSLFGESPTRRSGIVIMHGLGEHKGRYAHVVRFFHSLAFSVRCYDHRGHGKSTGRKGDVPDEKALLNDAKMVIDDFAHYISGPPLLLGHSMGGLTAAHFALAGLSPLRGLILSSPALAISLSRPQHLLLKVMHALAPGLGVPNGLSTQHLSHDASVINRYKNDPLVHPVISARLLRSMLEAIEFCDTHAASLALPTLLLVAGDDHLVNAEGSKRFAMKSPARLTTIQWYAALYHDIFNEIEAERVFDDIRSWLLNQQLMPQ